MGMIKRRRNTTPKGKSYWLRRGAVARLADQELGGLAAGLAAVGATAAARAVQRARQSVQGAVRHARRMQG